MSATTVHSFPAFHALRSPRGLMLAAIVVLHAAFFWSLNTGLSRSVLAFVPARIQASFIEETSKPLPAPPPKPDYQPEFSPSLPSDPPPLLGDYVEGTSAIHVDPVVPTQAEPVPDEPAKPVVVQPQVDAKRGLSEPAYTAPDVRQGNEGTVTLEKGEVTVPETLDANGTVLVPFHAGEALGWRFVG